MSHFALYILFILVGLQPSYLDGETEEERVIRLSSVAIGIDVATARATCAEGYDVPECEPIWPRTRRELAFLLITKAWWESRIARNVHENKCRRWTRDDGIEVGECDYDNKRRIFKARTVWQMQRTRLSAPEWKVMVGTSVKATTAAAWAATKNLAYHHERCGETIIGAISGYSGAGHCRWRGAGRRYVWYRKLEKAHPVPSHLEESPERLRARRERPRAEPGQLITAILQAN
jgi:hypothetical protein